MGEREGRHPGRVRRHSLRAAWKAVRLSMALRRCGLGTIEASRAQRDEFSSSSRFRFRPFTPALAPSPASLLPSTDTLPAYKGDHWLHRAPRFRTCAVPPETSRLRTSTRAS